MDNLETYKEVFKVLSDDIRLKILRELSKQDGVCVCTLVSNFNIQQSKLSYHLKMLLKLNLIIKERYGKWNYYKINKEELEKYVSKDVSNDIYAKIEKNFFE